MNQWRLESHPILEIPERKAIPFTWNNRSLQALEGDTIASALFANGVRIFGCHPKDNSPQGIFCANGQCAQCMVIAGGRQVKACMTHVTQANQYRVNAYRTADVTLRNIDEPAGDILEREGLERLILLPGIGESIAHSIEQMVRSGRLNFLERLQGETEPERILATVPGIVPELALRVHELNMINDWVVIYRDDSQGNDQWTVVASHLGPLPGKRIVRGREEECSQYYKQLPEEKAEKQLTLL